MTYITKPTVHHPALQKNALGLTRRDYEGAITTLCAGCGHDSITAAIIQAFWELSIAPHKVAKLSGIGCSSKTPAYFLREAHGFNGVHGRMPALVTGANAANRDIIYIGISGDGDSLSIGLGQLCHAIRRNVNVLYVLENNGVYGLTKGQFSASADPGSLSKKGEANTMEAIDGCLLALTLGATFVARSFSGDKAQLVPILKAGLAHNGFAFVDVISPCVTFNDHEGSTKSYAYTREKNVEVVQADFVLPTAAITTAYDAGAVRTVTHARRQLGAAAQGRRGLRSDRPRPLVSPTSASGRRKGEVVTGLLYLSPDSSDVHEQNNTVATPLAQVPFEQLCPGSAELEKLQRGSGRTDQATNHREDGEAREAREEPLDEFTSRSSRASPFFAIDRDYFNSASTTSTLALAAAPAARRSRRTSPVSSSAAAISSAVFPAFLPSRTAFRKSRLNSGYSAGRRRSSRCCGR